MPRFSENEKEHIKAKMYIEGERLFTAYGLKKVTIDDIIVAVNIAKATFYTFYESKEALFLDIAQEIQQKIFNELDSLLKTNSNLDSQERVRQVFAKMYALMLQHPILSQIDDSVIEIVSRKVGSQRLAMFSSQNLNAVLVLINHGIKFSCSPEVASSAFQSLYYGWLSLKSLDEKVQTEVANILLNGAIEAIVCK